MDKPTQNSKKPENQKQYNGYLKYSGLAIQMVVTIYLGNWFGKYLDSKQGGGSELYTKIITLLAVFLSIFVVIRQVIKSQ